MSKHTPGPWIVRNRDSVYAKSGRFVADCELTPYTARPKPPIGEDAANATLIAAAPAMYEALSMAQATIERLQRHAPGSALGTLDVISKALAQADGGE